MSTFRLFSLRVPKIHFRYVLVVLIGFSFSSLVILPATAQSDASSTPSSSDDVSEPAGSSGPEISTPSAAALRSIFSATAAPARKTMGLLQRSFLEVAQRTEDNLEIALVIDGTDSMAAEIEGVRQAVGAMLDDLRRVRSGEVRVAVVAYRDSGSPSGAVQILLDRFTDDDDSISLALQQLQPEDGSPFFHEMPDVGVQTALDQLPWSEDKQTTRWLFLFGDAPPYAENYFNEELPEARRAYATDLLIALAARKEIQIHCVLCTSTDELEPAYRAALPETRAFMNALASGTGGLMLDLSYPDIRQAVMHAGRQPRYDYLAIEPITHEDLIAARDAELNKPAEADPVTAEVRVAVLPHLPIQQMKFDPTEPAVQVATGLHHKLENLPRVRVVSTYDIERQLRRLRAQGLNETQQLRTLAARLSVDYVVWGKMDPAGSPIVSTVYSGRDAGRIVEVSHGGEVAQLASVILDAPTDDKRFGSLRSFQHGMTPEVVSNQLQKPLARQPSTTRLILTALEAMQQSLGLLADDPQSKDLLETAKAAAEAVLVTEPRNALADWLLANIHFNLAIRAQSAGEVEAAKVSMAEMKRALGRAYRNRSEIGSLSLASEVVADHLFLVDRDLPKAIEYYEKLTTNPAACPSVRRRAHWVLTGIYSGDWAVGDNFIDAKKARAHAIAILANWEASPEATLLRKWLGWDPETNRTEHPHLPRAHGDLAQFALDAPPAG